MRILIRTSKWAIWARRFGSFALPLTILPVLLHREQLIGSEDFAIVEAVAAAIAGVAVLLGLGAFARLWVTGDQGWGKAVAGILFGGLCLLPFAYLAYEASRYPMVNEVSTDYSARLSLVIADEPAPADATQRALIAATFPTAQSRTYPIEATEMFPVVAQLVDERGWDVRIERAPPTALGNGQINAIAMTLVGWRDEVAIRVAGSANGSAVAMRSVPLGRMHDFGENGRRIEDFLLALDAKVTLLLRDAPVAPASGEPESEAPVIEEEDEDDAE